MIKEIALSLCNDVKKECQKNWYTKWVIGLLVCGMIGSGVWKIYKMQKLQKEHQAQVAFSLALDEYNMLLSTAVDGDSRWEDLTVSFKSITQKYPHTVYGSFAQTYLADAFAQKGSLDESISLLEQWLLKNNEKNPLYYLYKTKLALLYCDAQNSEKGITLLKELANLDKNKQKDMAQFFAGYYYWSIDNLSEARAFWQPLIDNNKSLSKEASSPWASIAESKLQYIS